MQVIFTSFLPPRTRAHEGRVRFVRFCTHQNALPSPIRTLTPLFYPKSCRKYRKWFPWVNILFVEIFHACFIPVIASDFSEKVQNVPLYRPLCKNSSVSIWNKSSLQVVSGLVVTWKGWLFALFGVFSFINLDKVISNQCLHFVHLDFKFFDTFKTSFVLCFAFFDCHRITVLLVCKDV